jgi:type IV secretion system protein VirB10
MKVAALSTLLGMGTELATSDENRLIRAIRDLVFEPAGG